MHSCNVYADGNSISIGFPRYDTYSAMVPRGHDTFVVYQRRRGAKNSKIMVYF
jgi:hypothetical protein